jgi:phosphoribosylformylglycinamidine cyclo-ligase
VISGIADGCEQAGCALVGGETAEMPGMYAKGDYDLAGFCVGVVEARRSSTAAGHAGRRLIGLPHRRALQRLFADPQDSRSEWRRSRGRSRRAPACGERCWRRRASTSNHCSRLIASCRVARIAHITGGGLLENIPRVLPDVRWLASAGGVARQEMYRTFNCGVGMVVCVPEQDCERAIGELNAAGEQAWRIGRIETIGSDGEQVRLLGC